MKLDFNSISEPTPPGLKWQKLFNTHWAAYRDWLNSKGAAHTPDLKTSQAALKKYMPEMLPTYERLCSLTDGSELAAKFLTGFQPPAYISACAQAVVTEGTKQLVRNYDYHPDLIEGSLMLSAWNGKKVMANIDCLIGVLDGMNEDGLAISLTFGGRKVVGEGFGIPFILRYVLEFCSNVQQAVAALTRIPSHMSYNVTVLDRSGAFKTVWLRPDRAPHVSDTAFAANHQGVIDWQENASFNKTLKRSAFLEKMLLQEGITANEVADAFLQPPLYSTRFSESFGTLYTAVYQPEKGTVHLRWLNDDMLQTFDHFQEMDKVIHFNQAAASSVPANSWAPVGTESQASPPTNWQGAVADAVAGTIAPIPLLEEDEEAKTIREKIIHRGEVSWEILADYWANIGKGYWGKWGK